MSLRGIICHDIGQTLGGQHLFSVTGMRSKNRDTKILESIDRFLKLNQSGANKVLTERGVLTRTDKETKKDVQIPTTTFYLFVGKRKVLSILIENYSPKDLPEQYSLGKETFETEESPEHSDEEEPENEEVGPREEYESDDEDDEDDRKKVTYIFHVTEYMVPCHA